jgi:hypothetical protein
LPGESDEGGRIAYTLLHIEKHRQIDGDILGARSSRANKVFCSGSKEKFVSKKPLAFRDWLPRHKAICHRGNADAPALPREAPPAR